MPNKWTPDTLKEYFDGVRASDQEAVKVAHQGVVERMAGFPQEYATKIELDATLATVTRLEKNAISREIYEQNHSNLEEVVKRLDGVVAKLDRETLPEAVFNTFLTNYRSEQLAMAESLRDVSTQFRLTVERQRGKTATWGQIGAVLAGVVGFLTILVIAANYAIQ